MTRETAPVHTRRRSPRSTAAATAAAFISANFTHIHTEEKELKNMGFLETREGASSRWRRWRRSGPGSIASFKGMGCNVGSGSTMTTTTRGLGDGMTIGRRGRGRLRRSQPPRRPRMCRCAFVAVYDNSVTKKQASTKEESLHLQEECAFDSTID